MSGERNKTMGKATPALGDDIDPNDAMKFLLGQTVVSASFDEGCLSLLLDGSGVTVTVKAVLGHDLVFCAHQYEPKILPKVNLEGGGE